MRRYGGLRTVMPITFVTFGLGYLAIIGVPPFAGFFSKDKIIEAAFAAERRQGRGPRHGHAARCGTHRLLHDPGDADDVLRTTAMGPGRATRRECHLPSPTHTNRPAVMTVPMILLAVGRSAPARCSPSASSLQHWLEPVVGAHHDDPPCPCGRSPPSLWRWCSRRRGRLPAVRRAQPIPEVAPDRRSPHSPSRPGGTCTATRSTRRRSCVPGQELTRALVVVDERGVDGAVDGLRRARRRDVEAGAAAADRVRPLVRAVDVRRCGTRGRAMMAVSCGDEVRW